MNGSRFKNTKNTRPELNWFIKGFHRQPEKNISKYYYIVVITKTLPTCKTKRKFF